MKCLAARKWLIVSMLMVILAFWVKALALENAGNAVGALARATQDRADGLITEIPETTRVRAGTFSQRAGTLGTWSFSLMIGGGVFLAVSAVTREPVKRDVPLVFWVLCMLCQLVTV